jgi:hypothetical protein
MSPPHTPRLSTSASFQSISVQTLFKRQLSDLRAVTRERAPTPELPPLASRGAYTTRVRFAEPAAPHPNHDPRCPRATGTVAPQTKIRFGGGADGSHWMTGPQAAAPFTPAIQVQQLDMRARSQAETTIRGWAKDEHVSSFQFLTMPEKAKDD